jgi:6-phospho-beta-glucosidase
VKLTLLGCGIRTPLLITGLARRRDQLPLEEVTLYDTDETRAAVMQKLASGVARRMGACFDVRAASQPDAAFEGADFVFSAIRVGQEPARVIDEEVPLRYGVVGQETTGPGGFAMALRTIPAMLDYAAVIEEVAPSAWLINFTNPAGLVTEALARHTNVRAIGICDTPSAMKRTIARQLGVEGDRLSLDYVGLNHLGWVRKVMLEEDDKLPRLIEDYRSLQRAGSEFALFEPELIGDLGMLPNEYLYYFYYRELAVENIKRSGSTRGRQLQSLNLTLWSEIEKHLAQNSFEEAWRAYREAMTTRSLSYMARESGRAGGENGEAAHEIFEGEGYEGLAMAVMASIVGRWTVPLIVNVPNQGTLAGFDNDVFELPSVFDGERVKPLPTATLPDEARALIEPVKAYERMTVEAAVTGSYAAALKALAGHPLVCSYSLAGAILDDYLSLHSQGLGRIDKADRRRRVAPAGARKGWA